MGHRQSNSPSLFSLSGLALESLITVLTPRFIPFFMILWIICELPLLVAPRFLLTICHLLPRSLTLFLIGLCSSTPCAKKKTSLLYSQWQVTCRYVSSLSTFCRAYTITATRRLSTISRIRSDQLHLAPRTPVSSLLIACFCPISVIRLTYDYLSSASGTELRRTLCLGRHIVHNPTPSPMVCPTE